MTVFVVTAWGWFWGGAGLAIPESFDAAFGAFLSLDFLFWSRKDEPSGQLSSHPEMNGTKIGYLSIRKGSPHSTLVQYFIRLNQKWVDRPRIEI